MNEKILQKTLKNGKIMQIWVEKCRKCIESDFGLILFTIFEGHNPMKHIAMYSVCIKNFSLGIT